MDFLRASGDFTIALLLLGTVVGCADAASGPAPLEASDKTIHFAPESVNADQHFADAAIVSDDRLTIPTAGNERTIAKLKEGSVLAGNRSNVAMEANPYGFLVRVKSIQTEGANTILMTENAELADWIDDGDIDLESPVSLLGSSPSGLTTQTAGGKKDNGTNTGKGTAKMSNARIGDVSSGITLTSAEFSMNTNVSGSVHLHKPGILGVHSPVPTGVKFELHATLDPQIVATWNVAFTKEIPLTERGWKAPRVDIPLAGPLPLTVSFQPEWSCSLAASGTLSASVRTTVTSHLDFGFEVGAGLTDIPIPHNKSSVPTFDAKFDQVSMTGTESMSAECKIVATVGIHLFRAINLEGSVGPYIRIGADACSQGVTITESNGFVASIKGGVQFPFIHKGVGVTLLSKEAQLGSTRTLYGADNNCNGSSPTEKGIDSCAGRADGFYCSEAATYAGFYCEDGQILGGNQCDLDQQCQGGTKDEIRCR